MRVDPGATNSTRRRPSNALATSSRTGTSAASVRRTASGCSATSAAIRVLTCLLGGLDKPLGAWPFSQLVRTRPYQREPPASRGPALSTSRPARPLNDGPRPKHAQLSDALADLAVQELGPDAAIPSERDLMTSYDVSRATVRKAIDSLVA